MDVVAAAAVVVLVGWGVLVGVEVARLAGLIDAGAATASSALEQLARSVTGLAGLPVVGPQLGPLGAGVGGAAADVRVNGAAASAAVRTLAVLVGVAMVVVVVPLVGGYGVLRVGWARMVRDLRRACTAGTAVDPVLVGWLAHAAAARLPYRLLRQVSVDPWADLAAGRYHRLAAAELHRLGVEAPVSWTGPGQARR